MRWAAGMFSFVVGSGMFTLFAGSHAFADGVDNGGEYLAMEFTRFGRDVFLSLEKFPGLLDNEQMADFDRAIRNNRVDAVNGPILDSANRQVDARVVYDDVYREYVIEIDRNAWPDIFRRRVFAHQLVFHEYLRVLQIDDDNYVVSTKISEEPYASFLAIRVPSLEGTHIWEQLKDYYSFSDRPDWERLQTSREFTGVCFTEGDDVGKNTKFQFFNRANGSILPPSKMLNVVSWNSFHRNWNTTGEDLHVLVIGTTSVESTDGIFEFRIFGETLIVKRGTAFCFAELNS